MLIVAALAWDASGRATEPFPFAATDLARGQPITPDVIEWRPTAVGSLTMPDLTAASAASTITAGDPIVPSLLTGPVTLDGDVWAVPIGLPVGLQPGSSVRLVFQDGTATGGVVVQPSSEDSLGLVTDGLVAVPRTDADAVALAASNSEIVVLVRP